MPILAKGGVGGSIAPLIASAPPASNLDPDAQSFFAVMDAAGETYWQSEVAMVDAFVKDLKAANLWSLMTLLWVPVGSALNSAMRALKHPQGAGFRMESLGFTQSDWDRNLGLKGTGSASIDSKISGSSFNPTSVSLFAGITSEHTTFHSGYGLVVRDSNNLCLLPLWGNKRSYFRSNGSSLEAQGFVGSTTSTKRFIGTNTGNSATLYHDSSVFSSNTGNSASAFPSDNLFLFRDALFRFAEAGAGTGLNGTQSASLDAAISKARIAREALTP